MAPERHATTNPRSKTPSQMTPINTTHIPHTKQHPKNANPPHSNNKTKIVRQHEQHTGQPDRTKTNTTAHAQCTNPPERLQITTTTYGTRHDNGSWNNNTNTQHHGQGKRDRRHGEQKWQLAKIEANANKTKKHKQNITKHEQYAGTYEPVRTLVPHSAKKIRRPY